MTSSNNIVASMGESMCARWIAERNVLRGDSLTIARDSRSREGPSIDGNTKLWPGCFGPASIVWHRWGCCYMGSAVHAVVPVLEGEVLVRISFLTIMAFLCLLGATSARAQTYDPRFPVACTSTPEVAGVVAATITIARSPRCRSVAPLPPVAPRAATSIPFLPTMSRRRYAGASIGPTSARPVVPPLAVDSDQRRSLQTAFV